MLPAFTVTLLCWVIEAHTTASVAKSIDDYKESAKTLLGRGGPQDVDWLREYNDLTSIWIAKLRDSSLSDDDKIGIYTALVAEMGEPYARKLHEVSLLVCTQRDSLHNIEYERFVRSYFNLYRVSVPAIKNTLALREYLRSTIDRLVNTNNEGILACPIERPGHLGLLAFQFIAAIRQTYHQSYNFNVELDASFDRVLSSLTSVINSTYYFVLPYHPTWILQDAVMHAFPTINAFARYYSLTQTTSHSPTHLTAYTNDPLELFKVVPPTRLEAYNVREGSVSVHVQIEYDSWFLDVGTMIRLKELLRSVVSKTLRFVEYTSTAIDTALEGIETILLSFRLYTTKEQLIREDSSFFVSSRYPDCQYYERSVGYHDVVVSRAAAEPSVAVSAIQHSGWSYGPQINLRAHANELFSALSTFRLTRSICVSLLSTFYKNKGNSNLVFCRLCRALFKYPIRLSPSLCEQTDKQAKQDNKVRDRHIFKKEYNALEIAFLDSIFETEVHSVSPTFAKIWSDANQHDDTSTNKVHPRQHMTQELAFEPYSKAFTAWLDSMCANARTFDEMVTNATTGLEEAFPFKDNPFFGILLHTVFSTRGPRDILFNVEICSDPTFTFYISGQRDGRTFPRILNATADPLATDDSDHLSMVEEDENAFPSFLLLFPDCLGLSGTRYTNNEELYLNLVERVKQTVLRTLRTHDYKWERFVSVKVSEKQREYFFDFAFSRVLTAMFEVPYDYRMFLKYSDQIQRTVYPKSPTAVRWNDVFDEIASRIQLTYPSLPHSGNPFRLYLIDVGAYHAIVPLPSPPSTREPYDYLPSPPPQKMKPSDASPIPSSVHPLIPSFAWLFLALCVVCLTLGLTIFAITILFTRLVSPRLKKRDESEECLERVHKTEQLFEDLDDTHDTIDIVQKQLSTLFEHTVFEEHFKERLCELDEKYKALYEAACRLESYRLRVNEYAKKGLIVRKSNSYVSFAAVDDETSQFVESTDRKATIVPSRSIPDKTGTAIRVEVSGCIDSMHGVLGELRDKLVLFERVYDITACVNTLDNVTNKLETVQSTL